MGCATRSGGMGIVGGHAYSVMEVRELAGAAVGDRRNSPRLSRNAGRGRDGNGDGDGRGCFHVAGRRTSSTASRTKSVGTQGVERRVGHRERGVDLEARRRVGPHPRRRRHVLDELARFSRQVRAGGRVQSPRGMARRQSPRDARRRLRGGGGHGPPRGTRTRTPRRLGRTSWRSNPRNADRTRSVLVLGRGRRRVPLDDDGVDRFRRSTALGTDRRRRRLARTRRADGGDVRTRREIPRPLYSLVGDRPSPARPPLRWNTNRLPRRFVSFPRDRFERAPRRRRPRRWRPRSSRRFSPRIRDGEPSRGSAGVRSSSFAREVVSTSSACATRPRGRRRFAFGFGFEVDASGTEPRRR